jgi:hypothetical protein
MYLYFVDESGIDRKTRFLVVGGMIVEESLFNTLKGQLAKIKSDFHISKSMEVGWNNNYKSNIRKLKKGKLIDLRKRILSEISTIEADFIAIIADKMQYPGREDIVLYSWAMERFLERFHMLLQDKGRKLKRDTYGLVIADPLDRKEYKDRVRRKFHNLLTDGSGFNFSRILVNIMLPPSELSPGIQFSDFIVGALGSYSNAIKYPENRCKHYYDDIKNKFYHPKAKIEGYGIDFIGKNPGVGIDQ